MKKFYQSFLFYKSIGIAAEHILRITGYFKFRQSNKNKGILISVLISFAYWIKSDHLGLKGRG